VANLRFQLSWYNITLLPPPTQHHSFFRNFHPFFNRLTNTIHLTLKMTSAQVVETSVTNNSSFQNDHTIRTTDTPGFKLFTTSRVSLKTSTSNSETDFRNVKCKQNPEGGYQIVSSRLIPRRAPPCHRRADSNIVTYDHFQQESDKRRENQFRWNTKIRIALINQTWMNTNHPTTKVSWIYIWNANVYHPRELSQKYPFAKPIPSQRITVFAHYA